MTHENQTKWEALLAGIGPDRCAKEILFDPLIEDWALAGVSEGYRDQIRHKDHSDQERAILLDRLRWVVQKRLSGREQEIMLLFLAGCSQVRIAEILGVSRSTVRRSLVESGERLAGIVAGTDLLDHSFEREGVRARLVPLDTEDDFQEFLGLVARVEVRHIALGTFSDLREALVVFRE